MRSGRWTTRGDSVVWGPCWASYRSGRWCISGTFLRTKSWGSGVLLGKSGVGFFYFLVQGGCGLDARMGDGGIRNPPPQEAAWGADWGDCGGGP